MEKLKGMDVTLEDVKRANGLWFHYKSKEFCQDKDYWVKYGGTTGNPFLLRSTYMFSDMFGGKKEICYRINVIGTDLIIGNLIDDVFKTEGDAIKHIVNM